MKVNYTLSTKHNSRGYSEILISMFPYINGRLHTMRTKSGIFINSAFFDKKTGINAESLSRKHLHTPELRYHKEQADALHKLVLHIDERLAATDRASMPTDWLKTVVREYYHPEMVATIPQKAFYELADEYIAKKPLSALYVRGFYVVVRTIARYEMFLRETQFDKHNYTFDVNTVSRDEIEDLRDYMRHEKTLSKEYPTLFERMIQYYPASVKTTHKEIKERGTNTIVSKIKKLKAFFMWLNEENITNNHPFDGVKIGSEQYGVPIYITIDERNTIATTAMPTQHLETQRDIFIFQCLVGCRVGDMYKFTERNITNGMLTYTPHKTKNEGEQTFTARVPLMDEARTLIAKYKGKDKQGRLFPFITQQRYNDTIKEVFALAGITRNVEVRNSLTEEIEIRPINEIASSHMARRTFIGNLYFKVQDPTLIGQMSGHVEGSKAFQRYRKIEDETLRNIINYLK